MPGKLKVRILAANNLPVMDRASELTDAFVEVKFGNTIFKTDVCRKSLNPQWNSDWYKFEVDDEDLQDEPLQIRVLDHDTYTAHDAIGKVYIDLNPLLNGNKASVISGWYPIYDTMHGIQGQLNVVVKVDLFSDLNKFRQSSCGVKFFCTSGVPEGYAIQALHGFVEELVVNDDPEYQWIDKIRSMRASNEARQMQFSKLSGQLQRKIGLKVLEMGGNAVIGYRQCFDLEGESGVVVRAIGTSVTLGKPAHLIYGSSPHSSSSPNPDQFLLKSSVSKMPHIKKYHLDFCLPHLDLCVNNTNTNPCILTEIAHDSLVKSMTVLTTKGHLNPRRLNINPRSDIITKDIVCSFPPDDIVLSTSPTNIATAATPSTMGITSPPTKMLNPTRRLSESDADTPLKGNAPVCLKTPFHRPVLQQESIDMLEYPFFTIKSLPRGFIVHLGGVISASSVKLLDKINDPDEPKTRDVWWAELRTEIRSHMKAMGCHAVIGYSERTSIHDELIILSAIGTAALVNLNFVYQSAMTQHLAVQQPERHPSSGDRHQSNASELASRFDKEYHDMKRLHVDVALANQSPGIGRISELDGGGGDQTSQCSICHIPYLERSLPFPVHLSKCSICFQGKVPDILFTTIEPPSELPIVGKGCFLQARICRSKKESRGEGNAKEVSDSLPFVEYELHKQLVNKLKVKGMNSLFGLNIQIAIGETQLVAMATATGVFSEPLPPPGSPKIICKSESILPDSSVNEIYRLLQETIHKNREIYHLPDSNAYNSSARSTNQEDSDDGINIDIKLPADTFVFEIDDAEDAQVVRVLIDPIVPEGFEVCNVERMPGVPHLVSDLQMFSKVWRGTLSDINTMELCDKFNNIMKSLFFKFRLMTPCALCHLDFDIDISDEDEIQVSVTGMCVGIGEPPVPLDQAPSESGRDSVNTLVSRGSFRQSEMDMDRISDVSEVVPLDGMRTSPIQNQGRLLSPTSQGQLSRSDTHGTTFSLSPISKASRQKRVKYHSGNKVHYGIHLSPLCWISGAKIDQYVGHLNFFIIRETTSVREEGGLNGFMHSFLAEVLAICRAHVAALGGNALVAYQLTECIIQDNLHKNQSQCLVNVCGDVVSVVYECDTAVNSSPKLHLLCSQ